MKLPVWIPQVSKPWNPAFQETWGVMTPNERRWSWVFDAVLVITVLLVLVVLQQGAAT